MTDQELKDLLQRAAAAFAALTPEQQAAHRRDQAIDFAFGQLACMRNGPGITRERIAEIYDARKAEPQGAPQHDPLCPECGSVNPSLCRLASRPSA